MIDTIKFRLNNVENYKIIRAQYERTSQTGETTVIIDEDTGEIAENRKIRAMLHHDTDTIIPLTKRSKLHVASSNYNLHYFYNISQGFIEFEFAIPKYLYGTNILQFINYYDQDCDTIYKKLIDFVVGFAKKYFMEPILFSDLELIRLDMCYNQFFNSKGDALLYLNEQKELLKKHARSTKNDYRSYETSLMYITGRYSFKIYHKGTEFNKNDKKELAKKNATKENIQDLQDISDKILRYEVTFRKSQLNYLFEQAELHNKYTKFLHSENSRKMLRLANRDIYERTIEFVNQSKHFVFAKVEQFDAINKQMVAFDKEVFTLCYDFFWATVKKYQLHQKKSVYDIVKQIDENNETRDKIADKGVRAKNSMNKPMLVVLAMLTNYTTLDDIRKSGLLSDRTFYRYKAQLKKLGIDSEARLTDMPPPSLDYSDYKYYFGKHHLK